MVHLSHACVFCSYIICRYVFLVHFLGGLMELKSLLNLSHQLVLLFSAASDPA